MTETTFGSWRVKGQWSEYCRLVLLGVMTIVAVIAVRHVVQGFYPLNSRRGTDDLASPTAAANGVTADRPTPDLGLPVASVPIGGKDAAARGALVRAWAYLAKQTYDAKLHDHVLQDLVAAYKTTRLSSELNNALTTAIQQVNEIGVIHTVEEAKVLTAAEAKGLVDSFILHGSRLTKAQRSRVQAAAGSVPSRSLQSR